MSVRYLDFFVYFLLLVLNYKFPISYYGHYDENRTMVFHVMVGCAATAANVGGIM